MEQNKNSDKTMTIKEKMILLAAGGILILILFIPGSRSKSSSEPVPATTRAGDTAFEFYDSYTKALEDKLCAILGEVEGIGKLKVMITLDSYEQNTGIGGDKKTVMPKVCGVVVACEGGESAVVEEKITLAVQALFSIDSHKIKVLKMK